MKETFIQALHDVQGWFRWAPSTLGSLFVLVMMGSGAAAFTGLVLTRVSARMPGRARSAAFVRSCALAIRWPTQLAVAALIMILAIPALSISPDVAGIVAHLLAVIIVLSVGFGLVRFARQVSAYYVGDMDALSDVQEENILGRKHITQVRLLERIAAILIGVLTIGAALMTFQSVRQYGLSLLASAGAASIIVGFAARSVLSNLIAGAQIALTQPIRMGDMIFFNNDWTWVEEINATFVVLRAWDKRRRIVPLSYFLDNPFENWTYNSAELIGAVYLYLDFLAPMGPIRAKLEEIVEGCPHWNGKDFSVQVADATERTIMIRITAGARTAVRSWELRCAVREGIVSWIRDNCPEAFPQTRFSAHPSAQDNPQHVRMLDGPQGSFGQ